ncbi:MAG: hypothetical protein A3F95_02415 [Candidatus Nealsonbacteria bacterium RIFCSPLOWO2_12_FULL_39_31]|uniref:DUF5698 domain-containing protein n=3 Tax=Candidatus Nealsoniibacteriota TaxID=1817911 RepID=A0A1G2EIU2_9BACT|nr:MAG: hypothetical protein US88_C0006G0017 [Parcubacteria group bacterium GW2011_GWA2_38_27]KKQ97935.1 MAG: hypothetical protein UT22_C0006G0016 [Parcubacteria group bacterium GW2011_GWC2_39_11]OGZ20362.1 MAG: hypothetical protein A2626_00925 [Candidatus Nealsonbacteria bacterium RIFCSPHIGHO2_01_FULL_38_55]OGZ21251.1 MAG: hypothetical protein A3C48_02170 [Candidatus Nealsonbacteria bacterium RIFCSPHIGHO2_02_FULL_38_75]OGZ21753.1 MAG: hypothetical protein A2W55_00480 [Candidatus Nealsonbacteri
MEFLIYFIAGVAQDFLSTLNWRYVAEKKILPSMIFSFLTVAVGMVVLYNIVKDLDPQKSILAIMIYCAGIAGGTFLAMKFKLGLKS